MVWPKVRFSSELDVNLLRNVTDIDTRNSWNSSYCLVCLPLALLRLSVCCEQLGDLTRSKQLCEESLVVASHCLPVNHADIASCERADGCHNVVFNIIVFADVFTL